MKATTITLLIMTVILIILVLPFIFIWAINTLITAGGIPFHIEGTFINWFAAFLIIALLHGGRNS